MIDGLRDIHGVSARQVWEVTLTCGGVRCEVTRTVIDWNGAKAALVAFDGWCLFNEGFSIPKTPVLLCPDCQGDSRRVAEEGRG